MKHCPIGAIVRVDELREIAGAGEVAAEHIEYLIQSERFGGSLPKKGPDYRLLLARRESMRIYRRLSNEAARVLTRHPRKKGGRR